jgi:hypothetical protein
LTFANGIEQAAARDADPRLSRFEFSGKAMRTPRFTADP